MKVSELYSYAPKSKIKAGQAKVEGEYQFFSSSADEHRRYDEYLYNAPAIIMGTGGGATLHFYDGKFATSTDCLVLLPNEKVIPKYLYYFFLGNFDILEAGFKGAGLKHTNKGYIDNIEIQGLPNLSQQRKIVNLFDSLSKTINNKRSQIDKLDNLIKARFVEMFGDPISNPHNWEKKSLSELAEIRIGPFGSLLHKEDYIENAHALVNPSHIIEGKIAVDLKLTVSNEKYEELSAYHLFIDDVVMGRRGEMGRCAVVTENGLLCGTGSMIIRSNGILKADFIQKIISFPSFKKTIEDMAVGQIMPNLNVPIVSNFMIICPPLEVQEQYYSFVEQIDKSKFAIKKSLEKTQLLFGSLMQEYFSTN